MAKTFLFLCLKINCYNGNMKLTLERQNGTFTDDRINGLFKSLSDGKSLNYACSVNHINRSTINGFISDYKEIDDEDDTLTEHQKDLIAFNYAFNEARAKGQDHYLKVIDDIIQNPNESNNKRVASETAFKMLKTLYTEYREGTQEKEDEDNAEPIRFIMDIPQTPKVYDLTTKCYRHYNNGETLKETEKIDFKNNTEELYFYLKNGGSLEKVFMEQTTEERIKKLIEQNKKGN